MKNRMERINVLLKKEISHIISRDINDPRINFISIISVDCSNDLKHAKVYFTSQDNDTVKMENLLNKASKFISHRLFERMHLKFIPKLKFYYDKGEVNIG